MVSTPQFTVDGAENGFGYCLPRIDVDDRGDGNAYEYWTTLGGFNSNNGGSPTADQILLSYRNAMKLYWLTNSFQNILALGEFNSGGVSYTLQFSGDIHIDDPDEDGASPLPALRTCGIGGSERIDSDGELEYILELNNKVARYYEENSFIGLGIYLVGPQDDAVSIPSNPGLQDTLYYSDSVIAFGQCNYDLGGTWDGRQRTLADGTDNPDWGDREMDIGFLEINGIPLLYWSSAAPPPSTDPEFTWDYELYTDGAEYSDDNGRTETFVDTTDAGLDFYSFTT